MPAHILLNTDRGAVARPELLANRVRAGFDDVLAVGRPVAVGADIP